jgi:hypothetical protein
MLLQKDYRLHGVISQSIELYKTIAGTTSNPTRNLVIVKLTRTENITKF